MSIPKDIDHLDIQITENGVTVYHPLPIAIGPSPNQNIPATLLVLPSKSDPSSPVQIRVTGLNQNGGAPRMLRDAIVVVPTTTVAELRMPLEWLCDGSATSGAPDPTTGDPTYNSMCAAGQTCVAGACADATAPPNLPTYNPGDVFGGGSAAGNGNCFDTNGCFAGGTSPTIDMNACTIPAPTGGSGLNVAINIAGSDPDGICGSSGCFIPLDGNSTEGWQMSGGNIQLPPSVCTKTIPSGKAAGVAVTTTCPTKTSSAPPCGPWTSVGADNLVSDAGAASNGPCGDAGIAGECATTIASGQNEPFFLAVDSTSVYWTDLGGGTVLKAPLGGGTITTLASGRVDPYAIAVSATSAYWVESSTDDASGGSVMMVPLSGGTPITVAAGVGEGLSVAVDKTNVYWGTTATYDGGVVAGAIWKSPLSGGTAVSLASVNDPGGLAVDATNVYWLDQIDSSGTGGETFAVVKVPIAGGETTTLTSTAAYDSAQLAVDGTNVYWTFEGTTANNFADGAVMSVPIGGGEARTLASGRNYPWGVAADGTKVYWTEVGLSTTADGGDQLNTEGAVMSILPSGGTPLTLASGQSGAVGIAVDATSVYWATAGTSLVGADSGESDVAPNTGTIMSVSPKTGGTASSSGGSFGSSSGGSSSGGDAPDDASVQSVDAGSGSGSSSGGGTEPRDGGFTPPADSGN